MTLRRAFRAAFVVVPVGLLINLAVTLAGTDRAVLKTASRLPTQYLLFALLLALVPWFTGAGRLVLWVRLLGHRITFRQAFHINLASDVGAAVTPTAVGGGLFKWGMVIEHGVSPAAAASLAALTAVEDIVFIALSVPVAIALSSTPWRHPLPYHSLGPPGKVAPALWPTNLWPYILLALLTYLGLRVLLGTRRGLHIRSVLRRVARRGMIGLRRTAREARSVVATVGRRGRWRFAASMGLTAIQWICRYSVPAVIVAYLGVRVDPFLFYALHGFVFLVMAVVPTPGATGSAEAAFIVMYGPTLPRGLIGFVTATWRFLTFYAVVSLGALLFLFLSRGRKPHRVATASAAPTGRLGDPDAVPRR